MRLNPAVCPIENVGFQYSAEPFKKRKDTVGLMQPLQLEGKSAALISVHPKLNPKFKLEIVAHEALHAAYPDLTERQVIRGAEMLAHVLWLAGYRKSAKVKKVK